MKSTQPKSGPSPLLWRTILAWFLVLLIWNFIQTLKNIWDFMELILMYVCNFEYHISILGSLHHSRLGIQIRKSKIYLNEVALRIGCRNMFWSQCFNQKLSGWTTLGPAIVVLAALVSRAACTIMAVPKVVQPVRLIKFWLKHCDQGTFLHWILSATSCK